MIQPQPNDKFTIKTPSAEFDCIVNPVAEGVTDINPRDVLVSCPDTGEVLNVDFTKVDATKLPAEKELRKRTFTPIMVDDPTDEDPKRQIWTGHKVTLA